MTAEQQIVQNDWETYLADTAKIILREQSPQRYFPPYLCKLAARTWHDRTAFSPFCPSPLTGRLLPFLRFPCPRRRLLEVRGRLYELITHCIPADVIIKTLTAELIRNLDGQLKVEITRQAAAYEHRLQVRRPPCTRPGRAMCACEMKFPATAHGLCELGQSAHSDAPWRRRECSAAQRRFSTWRRLWPNL